VADLFVGLGRALFLKVLGGNSSYLAGVRQYFFFFFFFFYFPGTCILRVSCRTVCHCVTVKPAHVYSIVIIIVWVPGLCMSRVWLSTIYHEDKHYASASYSLAFFISLLVICTSYLTIRSRLQSTAPDHDLGVCRWAYHSEGVGIPQLDSCHAH